MERTEREREHDGHGPAGAQLGREAGDGAALQAAQEYQQPIRHAQNSSASGSRCIIKHCEVAA
jgi:hypothetical protein